MTLLNKFVMLILLHGSFLKASMEEEKAEIIGDPNRATFPSSRAGSGPTVISANKPPHTTPWYRQSPTVTPVGKPPPTASGNGHSAAWMYTINHQDSASPSNMRNPTSSYPTRNTPLHTPPPVPFYYSNPTSPPSSRINQSPPPAFRNGNPAIPPPTNWPRPWEATSLPWTGSNTPPVSSSLSLPPPLQTYEQTETYDTTTAAPTAYYDTFDATSNVEIDPEDVLGDPPTQLATAAELGTFENGRPGDPRSLVEHAAEPTQAQANAVFLPQHAKLPDKIAKEYHGNAENENVENPKQYGTFETTTFETHIPKITPTQSPERQPRIKHDKTDVYVRKEHNWVIDEDAIKAVPITTTKIAHTFKIPPAGENEKHENYLSGERRNFVPLHGKRVVKSNNDVDFWMPKVIDDLSQNDDFINEKMAPEGSKIPEAGNSGEPTRRHLLETEDAKTTNLDKIKSNGIDPEELSERLFWAFASNPGPSKMEAWLLRFFGNGKRSFRDLIVYLYCPIQKAETPSCGPN